MAQSIFLNLPVQDLSLSRQFYEGLGYSINEQFPDDTAASVVISESIYVMLLTHPKYQSFTSLPIGDPRAQSQHLLALSFDSKDAVDAAFEAALAHGGSKARETEDYGFMYTRPFADPDGHVWEPFWMDPAAIEAGPPDLPDE